jgi:hypothetical protein
MEALVVSCMMRMRSFSRDGPRKTEFESDSEFAPGQCCLRHLTVVEYVQRIEFGPPSENE